MVTVRQVMSKLLAFIFVINILTTSALFVMLMFIGHYVLPKRYRQYLSCAVAWMLGHEFVFIGGWLSNASIVLYGKKDELERLNTGNYLVNMSHRYEIDFFTAWYLGCVTGIVRGAKVCLKEELRRVPILGKVWEGMGFIYLQRDWNKDKTSLDNYCADLNNYPLPYIVLIFCEGTRFTEVKLESSNEYAREHGLDPLKYHLIPRTKGFLHILRSLRGTLEAVYDITVRVEGAKPSVMNVLFGPPMTAHCHVRPFELDTVPTEDNECSKWLMKLYHEKDELVESFLKNGSFPGQKFPMEEPAWGMLVSIFFLVFYTLPIIYALSMAIISLPPTFLYVSVVVLFIVCGGLAYKIYGFSRISQASSYGLNQSAAAQKPAEKKNE